MLHLHFCLWAIFPGVRSCKSNKLHRWTMLNNVAQVLWWIDPPVGKKNMLLLISTVWYWYKCFNWCHLEYFTWWKTKTKFSTDPKHGKCWTYFASWFSPTKLLHLHKKCFLIRKLFEMYQKMYKTSVINVGIIIHLII